MEFTFGPRHRIVTTARRFSWWRVIATIVAFAGIGVLLALSATAHAATPDEIGMRHRAEQLNSQCRDAQNSPQACAARDALLRVLEQRGQCWNARAATPEALWVRCTPSDAEIRRVRLENIAAEYGKVCNQLGHMAYTARILALSGKTPAETNTVIKTMADRQVNTTQVYSAEEVTYATFTTLRGLTPASARAVTEGNCRLRTGALL